MEDFIIQNWDRTELGKKYDLLYEDGDIKSQQYKTDIGIIDTKIRKLEIMLSLSLKKGKPAIRQ